MGIMLYVDAEMPYLITDNGYLMDTLVSNVSALREKLKFYTCHKGKSKKFLSQSNGFPIIFSL